MRWKVIPLSGQDVILAADREEFPRKQGILQAPEKGCQAKQLRTEIADPSLEVIDKTGDYRYDLPGFHIGASFSHRALPPTEIEQPSPTELF